MLRFVGFLVVFFGIAGIFFSCSGEEANLEDGQQATETEEFAKAQLAQAKGVSWSLNGQTILESGNEIDFNLYSYYEQDTDLRMPLFVPDGLTNAYNAAHGQASFFWRTEQFEVRSERVDIYKRVLREMLLREEMGDKQQKLEKLMEQFSDFVEDNGAIGLNVDRIDTVISIINVVDEFKSMAYLANNLNYLKTLFSTTHRAFSIGKDILEFYCYMSLFESDLIYRVDAFQSWIESQPEMVDPALALAFCNTETLPCPELESSNYGGEKAYIEGMVASAGTSRAVIDALKETIVEELSLENLVERAAFDALPLVACKIFPIVGTLICRKLLDLASDFYAASEEVETMNRNMVAAATILRCLFNNQYEDLSTFTRQDLLIDEGRNAWERAKMQSYLSFYIAKMGYEKIYFEPESGNDVVQSVGFITQHVAGRRSEELLNDLRYQGWDAQQGHYELDTLLEGALDSLPPIAPSLRILTPTWRAGRLIHFDASESIIFSNGSDSTNRLAPYYTFTFDGVPAPSSTNPLTTHAFVFSGMHTITLEVKPCQSCDALAQERTYTLEIEPRIIGSVQVTPALLRDSSILPVVKSIGNSVTFQAGILEEGELLSRDIQDQLDIAVWPSKNVTYNGNATFTLIKAGYTRFIVSWEGEELGKYDVKVPFGDVPDGHWAAQFIDQLLVNGVIEGYGDGSFRPGNPINRAEFIKMLVYLLHLDPPQGWKTMPVSSECPFTDVPLGEWYFEPVMTAYGNGLVNVPEDRLFRPGDSLNRAEAAKLIVLAFNYEIAYPTSSPFSDVPTGQWYTPYINTIKTVGIVKGYPDGTFKPSDTINRAEAAKMIWNASLYAPSNEEDEQ